MSDNGVVFKKKDNVLAYFMRFVFLMIVLLSIAFNHINNLFFIIIGSVSLILFFLIKTDQLTVFSDKVVYLRKAVLDLFSYRYCFLIKDIDRIKFIKGSSNIYENITPDITVDLGNKDKIELILKNGDVFDLPSFLNDDEIELLLNLIKKYKSKK